ncbi:MAG: OmpP1/FadL family transporter [Beijerinckiaceae bacterium]
MKRVYRAALAAGVAGAALAASMHSANAGGFALREQSAAGMGVAFAGAAAGGAGLGSMFWNPATITQFDGWRSSWNISGIMPSSNITASLPTPLPLLAQGVSSGNIGQGAILPASYTSYQLTDKIYLGLATGAPYGLVTKANSPSASTLYGITSKVFSTEVTPTIGYKINDWLSVGAGIRILYFKVGLSQATNLAPPLMARLQGDAWAAGFTLGATLRPGPNTTIGIGYRSQMRPKLEGTFEANIALPAANGISANLVLPDQITVGITHKLDERWTLLAGGEWTHWSLFNRFPVISTGPFIPAGFPVTTLAFGWRDGWYASAGAEYKWSPNLKLRGGLGYEWSPITTATRGTRLPDSNRIWATAGFSWQVNEKISIDASYAHIFAQKGTIALIPGNPTFNGAVPYFGSARSHVDIVSFGLNYRWDTPVRAVVAKY